MKNIAVIFAGGTGRRMKSASRPKQFLELNGKPIIIYTLELFENHPGIDGIVVACLEEWIPYLKKLIVRFGISKVGSIVPGGDTGQESIYNGLKAAETIYGDDVNVLIHDGVRPLITHETISDNIDALKIYGNAITCVPATETCLVNQTDGSIVIPKRDDTIIVRAPQSFRLVEILSAHEMARKEGRKDFIDSCSLMNHYGYKLHPIMGPMENIKITTPADFYIFRAIVDMHENKQIFGF
ncbi:MAG: 2-C-methyl-D-erythritol 4-phosphate cytidylyltransferase [Muribaculaceae bacterium]|nr:2-C-methyl-D-erythritol 4-phosphate cytidylyltransferase [Muribaculaceae bacterium]